MTRPILYFVAVPTPYRNAELDRAALGLGVDEFTTIFSFADDATATWRPTFPNVCSYRTMNGEHDQHPLVLADLRDWLDTINPRYVILGGYRYHGLRETRAWCLENGVPYALRADSNIWEERHKGFARRVVRRFRLTPWVRRAHSCLVTGTYNRAYWEAYGMQPSQDGWWPQWINYDHFSTARQLRADHQAELRTEFGLTSPLNLLYVGRLISRKRVDLLCEAVLAADQRFGIVIAGSGTEEEKLRERYATRLGDRLRMLGAIPVEQMPKLYAACDVLGLASGATEPWALVLNEATAAGMAVVCNRRVGAAGDLVIDGQSGMLLNEDTVESWSAALNRLAANEQALAEMGHAGTQIADEWRHRSDPVTCLRKL